MTGGTMKNILKCLIIQIKKKNTQYGEEIHF